MSLIIDALKKLQKSRMSGTGNLPIRPYPKRGRALWEFVELQKYSILGAVLALSVAIFLFISPLKDLWTKKDFSIPEKKLKMAASSPVEKKPAPPPAITKETLRPQEIITRASEKKKVDQSTLPSAATVASLSKEKTPGEKELYSGPSLARRLRDIPQKIDAKQTNDAVRTRNTENLPHYFEQGVYFQNQKNFPEAIKAYNMALEIDPHYAEAYNNLGIIYSQTADFEKAIFCLQKAVTADPDYFKAYNNLGVILYQNGHLKKAEKQFWKAIEIYPKNIESYVNLSLVYRKQKNLDSAFEILQKGFSMDPEYPELSYHLGMVAEERKETREAIEHYQRFLHLSTQQNNILAQKVKEHVENLQRQAEARQK